MPLIIISTLYCNTYSESRLQSSCLLEPREQRFFSINVSSLMDAFLPGSAQTNSLSLNYDSCSLHLVFNIALFRRLKYLDMSVFAFIFSLNGTMISEACARLPHFFFFFFYYWDHAHTRDLWYGIEISFLLVITEFVLCSENVYSFYRSSAWTASMCLFYPGVRTKHVWINETPL